MVGFAMGFASAYLVILVAERLRAFANKAKYSEPSPPPGAAPARALKHPVCVSAVQRLLVERLVQDVSMMRSPRSNLERAAFTALVAIDVECCRQSAVPRELVDAALTNDKG